MVNKSSKTILFFTALRENVALNKTAKQSSTYKAHHLLILPATLAIDGNRNQYLTKQSVGKCTSTKTNEAFHWWAVDLGNEFDISDIKIYNRIDCCSYRLTNFFIEIYNPTVATWGGFDQGAGQLCYHYVNTAPSILNVACTSNILGRVRQDIKGKPTTTRGRCTNFVQS
ncbi:unnamed protein product [Mytilus coruscus]|uniref:Fucolectin tachylectin-4 pentraxin-1 domain-containing protein n=1 Tax=Mytilus coruscus TaxID=42192 RepID=A0A6J8AH03_MYTCO|nr:unnamed protein product [Mytilus coruscus]